ncbi:MAG: type II toxin-antitoxin system prevent-host-death family antitoxin [Gallionellaceae bacterium]|nr:MAG: type II toxin-antitoxin system prevent-host-death family antitoxin [Gallionellaceae bacterium]
MDTITAADANRQFSSLLRKVAQGETVTVTSRGKPVATISPAQANNAQRTAAKKTLLARLKKQTATGARNWTRDELYEG